jgi:hypothetical protein
MEKKMPVAKNFTPFEEALEDFRAYAEGVLRDHFARNDFTFAVPNIEIGKGGRKYKPLMHTESDPTTGEARGQRCIHSFVEIATGDIFKPATYKAPAKHARGNIYRGNGADALTDTGGVRYLR